MDYEFTKKKIMKNIKMYNILSLFIKKFLTVILENVKHFIQKIGHRRVPTRFQYAHVAG